MRVAILALSALVLLSGCTEQQRARSWGGTATTDLPTCQKLVHMAWKESDLWFLTRPMRAGEVPERYQFVQSESFGLVSGTVVVQEHRDTTCAS